MPEIVTGYRPGLIGTVTRLHSVYYADLVGFGAAFEATVARGLSEFVPRLDRPCNQVWVVVDGANIRGSVAIDGEDLGDGKAHLRWFIMDPSLRGGGWGRKLLSTALEFCDAAGFYETHLWTITGLPAAQHLYEAHGFSLLREYQGDSWGKPMTEQIFVRPKP